MKTDLKLSMKAYNLIVFTNLIDELNNKVNILSHLDLIPNKEIINIFTWINNNLGLKSYIFSSLMNTIFVTAENLINIIKSKININYKNIIDTINNINNLEFEINKLYNVISNTIKATILFLSDINKQFNEKLDIVFLNNILPFENFIQNIIHNFRLIKNKGDIISINLLKI